MRRAIDGFPPAGDRVSDLRASIEALQTLMPRAEKALARIHDELPNPTEDPGVPWSPQQQAVRAIGNGERKYGAVKAPTLVISPSPPACGSSCDSPAAKQFEALVASYIAAFQAGNPGAHIVRLAHASHQVWRSNEAQVEQEMNSFMDGLK